MSSHHNRFSLIWLLGMILIMPLFVFYFWYRTEVLPDERWIPLIVSDKTKKFSNYSLVVPERSSYKLFMCNGNDKHDKKELKGLLYSAQNMMKLKDSVQGVKIHFNDKATYNSFIIALRALVEAKVDLYEFEGNNLRAIYWSAGEERKLKKLYHIMPE